MRKCNKCSTIIEKKGSKLFCYRCQGFKLTFETYKFYSLINNLNKKI